MTTHDADNGAANSGPPLEQTDDLLTPANLGLTGFWEPAEAAENFASTTTADEGTFETAPEPPAPKAADWSLSRGQWLQIYLIGVIASNLYLLFFAGHFDIGFWRNWVEQLATTGFANYRGDYPPLWSDWLYCVSRFYVHFQMPIENDILFKYLTQLPITVYHLLLTWLIYTLVKAKNTSDTHFHTALAFTVFNPAILFNGPIWGQIDVTPLVPLIAGLMAGTSKRYQYLAMPLYTIAMLTKFQMIAFAPVFGILFLRNYKSHLVGILLSAPIFALAFLPAFLADNFKQAFSLPYIGAINMFSAATMGAANLWLLVVGNLAPDNSLLFGITPDSPLASIFSVRRLGMLSFSFVCLLVALAGVKNLFISKTYQNQARLRVDMFFYATLCAVTFFTLLPGMHERYLLPAAIVALAYYAVSPTKAFYPIMLGLISALNVTMQHGLKTYSIWPSLAWLMVGVFCYGLLEFLFGNIWLNFLRRLIFRVSSFRLFAICVFLISTAVTTNYLYQNNKIHRVTLAQNQTLLTQLPPTFTSQDWGALQINQSVAGTPLRLGKTRYAHGFGTHANSVIKFALPPNASQFSFTAGLDGAVEVANVQFSVLAGETLLWSSPVINRSNDNLGTVTLDLNDAKEITLRVSNLGSPGSDHSNWVNPVITLHD